MASSHQELSMEESLNLHKKLVFEGRKFEKELLNCVVDAGQQLSHGVLISFAGSLRNRLDAAKSVLTPNARPSAVQLMFSRWFSSPEELSRRELVEIILQFDRDFAALEADIERVKKCSDGASTHSRVPDAERKASNKVVTRKRKCTGDRLDSKETQEATDTQPPTRAPRTESYSRNTCANAITPGRSPRMRDQSNHQTTAIPHVRAAVAENCTSLQGDEGFLRAPKRVALEPYPAPSATVENEDPTSSKTPPVKEQLGRPEDKSLAVAPSSNESNGASALVQLSLGDCGPREQTVQAYPSNRLDADSNTNQVEQAISRKGKSVQELSTQGDEETSQQQEESPTSGCPTREGKAELSGAHLSHPRAITPFKQSTPVKEMDEECHTTERRTAFTPSKCTWSHSGIPTRNALCEQIAPTRQEMDAVFDLCRKSQWQCCLQLLKKNPLIGTSMIQMNNNIVTTVCHQAITSKGDVQARATVILQILSETPQAAAIKNGYGSLCLHSVCQRNVKIDSKTKERVALALVDAYPVALIEEGGLGRRTPLHIVFTDYLSLKLAKTMIDRGKQATFMKDKKGYLPLHVAASRHASPDKIRMLLEANPASLFETTNDGKTALQLATSTATRSHPNNTLMRVLAEALKAAKPCAQDTTFVV